MPPRELWHSYSIITMPGRWGRSTLSRRRQRRLQPWPRRHRQETGKRQKQTRMQRSLMRRPNRQPEAAVPAATGSEPEGQGGFPVGIAAALGIVALAGGGGVFFVMHRRAEEARQAALRRQRRRERLMEDGCEEEFERLLKERLNRPAAGRSERSGKREGTERNGRTERNERAERNERTERHEKTERRGTTENDERSI